MDENIIPEIIVPEDKAGFIDFDTFFSVPLIYGIKLKNLRIWDINLPTGNIVACDWIYAWDTFTKPFVEKVTPGKYPVHLCMAEVKEVGDLVAFAKIQFSDKPVAKWVVALNEYVWKDYDNDSYIIDSWMWCFMDEDTRKSFAKELLNAGDNGEDFAEIIEEESQTNENHDYYIYETEEDKNICIFMADYGEWGYVSSWWLDKDWNKVCLVTDFGLFDEEGFIGEWE